MTISTYRRRGQRVGVAVTDVPPGTIEPVGDVLERLTGSTPWEAEDGTLSVECDEPREAKAVAAYLRAYF